jgi:hypothetical protein
MNKRMPIAIAIERIEEVRDNNDDPDIIESSEAALTTLNLLFNLGFNEVSLLEEDDDG